MKKLLLALAAWLVVVFIGFIVVNLLHDWEEDPTDTLGWLNEETPEGQAIIKYSFTHIPCLAEFKKTYPQSSLTLWPSFAKRRGTFLTFETILYGKYDLNLDQEIRTDRKTRTAKPLGSPQLRVSELGSLDCSPEGSWTVSSGPQSSFGLAEWNRLVAVHGDLSAIMTGVDKTHPLPLAKKYLEMLQGQSVLP